MVAVLGGDGGHEVETDIGSLGLPYMRLSIGSRMMRGTIYARVLLVARTRVVLVVGFRTSCCSLFDRRRTLLRTYHERRTITTGPNLIV